MSEARWLKVKEKIQKLVDEYHQLQKENISLTEDVSKLGVLVEELKTKMEIQLRSQVPTDDINVLKAQLSRKDQMIEELLAEKDRAELRIKELEEAHSIKDSTLQVQKNTINELTEQNKLIKLAKEMSVEKTDTHELKIKINELIRDIDRCIDLLND